MKKVAVVGGRDFIDKRLLFQTLDILPKISEIVSGGAPGADLIAKEYAISRNIKYVEFRPDYSLHGRVAPLQRNYKIVSYSDIVIAFWNGVSKGTKNSIKHAKNQGKLYKIVAY